MTVSAAAMEAAMTGTREHVVGVLSALLYSDCLVCGAFADVALPPWVSRFSLELCSFWSVWFLESKTKQKLLFFSLNREAKKHELSRSTRPSFFHSGRPARVYLPI